MGVPFKQEYSPRDKFFVIDIAGNAGPCLHVCPCQGQGVVPAFPACSASGALSCHISPSPLTFHSAQPNCASERLPCRMSLSTLTQGLNPPGCMSFSTLYPRPKLADTEPPPLAALASAPSPMG